MGNLEHKLRERVRRTNFKKIILSTIFATAGLSLALIAPNAASLLKYFDKSGYRKRNPKYKINETIARLKEQGLISLEKTNRGTFVRLTVAGQKTLRKMGVYYTNNKRRWDGKWRIVIFDIKEKTRGVRDKLRISITNFGFKKLQNSVWVYPYDCEDLIILLKADFHIGKDILYIIADTIENDDWLKKEFGL